MIVKDWKYIETLRPSPEPLGQFNCHNTSLTNTAEFAAQMSYVANKAQLLSFHQDLIELSKTYLQVVQILL